MELDKTMEIIFPTFFYNISKIFPYYGRGPNFLENRRAKRGIDTEDRCHSLCVRRINVLFLRILVGRNAFLRTRCVCSRVFTVDQSLKARPKCSLGQNGRALRPVVLGRALLFSTSALWFSFLNNQFSAISRTKFRFENRAITFVSPRYSACCCCIVSRANQMACF